MAKSGKWENKLSPDEMRFLKDVAGEVAMLTADADVRTRFGQGLTKFASQYARFKESWEADQAGMWQPEMGKPANPLGAIWPVTYGTGWKTYDELKPSGAHIWVPVQIYRAIGKDAQLLGMYALLAVIHDMVLPNCEPIGAGCLPQELAREIWESLLNNADGEGCVPPIPGEAINKGQVKAALTHVKEDRTRVVSDVQEPSGAGAAAVREIEGLCAAAERLCELWRTTHLLPNIREVYEKARDEILPALETVHERLMAFCVQIGPDAFDAERKKNPALRSAEERLDVQLYKRRGIGAQVRKVESHRKNLRNVRARVNRFIAKLNETVRMLQRYSEVPSKPEITALGRLVEYLKHWSEDTPLDYEISGDSSHLAFLQARNGVRIVDTLGEPFDSVMRDLEMLEKKPINDLIAELRTGRDEILAFTRRNGADQMETRRLTNEEYPVAPDDSTAKAREVHELIRDNSVRERFKRQCEMLRTRWHAWKLGDSGPSPEHWLSQPGDHLPDNLRDVMAHMFGDHGSVMTPELELPRAYGFLTILHDHAMKNGYAPIAGPEIWPPDDQFSELVKIRWREMRNNWPAWHTVIDMALNDVRADLAQTEQRNETLDKASNPKTGEPAVIEEQGCAPLHVEINAAERTVTFGCQSSKVTSEQAWDLLKTLISNKKLNRITPRHDDGRDWKNAVDTLRRQVGKGNIHLLIQTSRDGYYLQPSVQIKYSAQYGIRRTKQ